MAKENATPNAATPKAPQCWGSADINGRKGTMEQLLAVGVPAAWMHNLPAPGKKRETRWLSADGCLVSITVGERRVFHIQALRMFNVARVQQQRGQDFARFLESAIGARAQG